MRTVSTPLMLAALAGVGLSACASSRPVSYASNGYAGSRCPPTSACAPANSTLRQYFDGSRHRYYYYDPLTYRYYWENGSPKT
jgi:hypothetical protein